MIESRLEEPPTSDEYVLAIDGGGSKVAGLLAKIVVGKPPQCILKRSIAGTGSAAPSTWHAARTHLLTLINLMVTEQKIAPAQIAEAIFMLAGAGRPNDVERVRQTLSECATVNAFRKLTITSDIQPMLAYASIIEPKLPTVVVISGTGSIVAAIRNQQLIRSGGWGPVLGDEASGFRFAQLAITEVCHWIDANGPDDDRSGLAKTLQQFLMDRSFFEEEHVGDRSRFASALLKISADRHACAQFAPYALDHCHAMPNCDLSRKINAQFEYLAKQVHQVKAQLANNSQAWRLGLAGGLGIHHPQFRSSLLAQLDRTGCFPIEVIELDPLESAISQCSHKAS